jgi:hypothetical protein
MEEVHARIARAVALALAQEEVRMSVFRALGASPYRESKLHLRTALASSLGMLASRASAHAPNLNALLDSVVDLEFYMPVPAHRNQWNGGNDLIVAGVLKDDGRLPVAFDLEGTPFPILSAKDPPKIPALMMVPVETDFSRPAEATASYAAMVDPPGVYMTYASIPQTYEGWGMGAPEFEIHAFLNQSGEFTDVSCGGEQRTGTQYYWNYDNPPNAWTGNLLVALESSISFGQVEFQVWEDDTGACATSGGRPPDTDAATWNNAKNVAAAIGWYFIEAPTWYKKLAKIIAAVPIVLNLGGFIHDDDLVGIVDGPSGGCFPSTGPAWFALRAVQGGGSTGLVALDMKFADSRSPVCPPGPAPLPDGAVTLTGPNAVKPTQSCLYTGGASGGTSPYTFTWYRNSVYIGSGSEINVGPLSPSFALSVVGTDATGRVGVSLTKTVTVSSGAPMCPM